MTMEQNKEKNRKLKVIVIWGVAWMIISPYIAYYIDAFLKFPVTHNVSFIWNPANLFYSFCNNSRLIVWMLFLWMVYAVYAVWIYSIFPENRLKHVNTIQVTDEIEIPRAVGNGQFGTARFATEKEFAQATQSYIFDRSVKPDRCGIVVEMKKNSGKDCIRFVGGNYHSIILGTTGSGKTRRILLETVCLQIMSGTSVVVSDVKGEIFAYTKLFAESQGYQVFALDFRQPKKSMRYNYLQPILDALDAGNTDKAIDETWDLVSVLVGEPKGEPLWYNGETATIAAGILCVAIEADRKYRNLTNVYYFLAYMCMVNPDTGETPLNYYLQTLPDNHPAKTVFSVAQVAAPRTRSSFFTSALGTLRLFTNPQIAAMTAESEFSLKDIGKRKTILYLIVPDEKKTLYPLASLLIQQLYIAQVDVANDNGLCLPVPTDYDLDEVGNFPVIPVLENIASAGRSRGIRMNLVLQDYQQMKEKYKESFETIKTCCQVKILLKTDSAETVKEISQSLDHYTVEATSASVSTNTGHTDANYQTSSNMTGRPLLYPSEIGQIKSPYALVMIMGHRPKITFLPDLLEYELNDVLGLGDEETNREIIRQRELARPVRYEKYDVPLWGIWKKYQDILERNAEKKISFLK